MTYTNPTDEQQSAARLADRGDNWMRAELLAALPFDGWGDELRQAMHDRDRFQREAAYWHEECIKLTGEALA